MNRTTNNKIYHTSCHELFTDTYSALSNHFCKRLKIYNITPEPYSSENIYLSDPSDTQYISNLIFHIHDTNKIAESDILIKSL